MAAFFEQSGSLSYLSGCVAKRMVRLSTCPVVTIKPTVPTKER
jgi:nucleotide-binding universal stress UspA family protein